MAEHKLTFPASEEDIRKLRAGDLVTVDGHILGIRDRTQIRIFDQGVDPPLDLTGAFLLHTAPNVRKLGPGKYEPMCVGTTTSARMVRFTEPLGRDHGVRAIAGKGGLPDEAIGPMQKYGMLLVFPLTAAKIVGTDIFHAAALLWVAGISYLVHGNVDLHAMGWLLLGSIPGVLFASKLTVRVPEGALRVGLGTVLLASGVRLIEFPAYTYLVPIILVLGGIGALLTEHRRLSARAVAEA